MYSRATSSAEYPSDPGGDRSRHDNDNWTDALRPSRGRSGTNHVLVRERDGLVHPHDAALPLPLRCVHARRSEHGRVPAKAEVGVGPKVQGEEVPTCNMFE